MFKNKLNAIRVILGLEVKLEMEKLIDGTILEAEAFEPGYPVFITNEDGTKTPAPEGTHSTESGKILEIDGEGRIVSISEVETEIEGEPQELAEVEIETIPETIPETPIEKDVIVKILDALEGFSKELEVVKAKMGEIESKFSKFSAEPAAVKFPTVHKLNEESSLLDKRIEQINNLKKDNFFKTQKNNKK